MSKRKERVRVWVPADFLGVVYKRMSKQPLKSRTEILQDIINELERNK